MTFFPVRLAVLFERTSTKIAFAWVFAAVLMASPLRAQTSDDAPISDSAMKQIQEIYAFKASYTPEEQKMSSNLVLASRAAHGQRLGKMARFLTPLKRDANGKVEIEVTGALTPSLMANAAMRSVEMVDGVVPATAFRAGHIRARVTDLQLRDLARHPDVKALSEATGYHTNAGSLTSQGYIAHAANKVIAGGVDGTGVKVGVISDSASAARIAALIASGDLPADTVVLSGQAGPTTGGDEGTAMMEIIHDVAPGAKLFFATADISEAQFAANIRALRFTYGCDIIVDDVSYFDEPAFQDGIVAQAVNDITAAGGIYFSSAANSGNLTSGTSGTWEGDFTSVANSTGRITTLEGAAVPINNFRTAASPQSYDSLTSLANSGVWLHWSDAMEKSANDYDLFILDSTGATVKGYGATSQTGTQNPLEYVYPSSTCATTKPTGYCPAVGDRIVVALYSGAARALHISTQRATVSIGTPGATIGHNAGASTVTMAAVFWNSAHNGVRAFTGGASNPVETFSSDGPRKIFYNPDGTAITPGNFLFGTNGGTTLQKPDASAADGVTTRTPGFNPFYGTSAAAPHAAGIAALVKSAAPSLTNVEIRQILTNTAMDNMAPGVDRDSGYGILSAPNAVAAAKALASAPR